MKGDDDLKTFFEKAKQKAQQLENSKVEEIDADKAHLKDLRERLYHMIQYAIGRHDWYDNQRHLLLQIGLALMAAGAAISAVVANLVGKVHPITGILFWIIGISFLLTGFSLLYFYNRGLERKHPYRKIVDIRSWFFAYTFPSGLPDRISNKPDTAKREVNEVIDALENFLDRWLEFAKNDLAFLKEDLEQVFILQLLQRYRSQQVKKMSKALFLGLLITGIVVILTLVSFLCFDLPKVDTRKSIQDVQELMLNSDAEPVATKDSALTEHPIMDRASDAHSSDQN
ncbi:MAG: hypothetical protein ACETWD_03925 [Desulfatiglandales bacterium]